VVHDIMPSHPNDFKYLVISIDDIPDANILSTLMSAPASSKPRCDPTVECWCIVRRAFLDRQQWWWRI